MCLLFFCESDCDHSCMIVENTCIGVLSLLELGQRAEVMYSGVTPLR